MHNFENNIAPGGLFRQRAVERTPVSLELPDSLGTIQQALPGGTGAQTCQWNSLALASHFQPIIGTAEQRVIGHEALLRASDVDGHRLSPAQVFALATTPARQLHLDWLSRALHMRNFRNLGVCTGVSAETGLLFINVAPDAAIHDPANADVFSTLISHCAVEPKDIVVEIIENASIDEVRLVEAVAMYKSLGCSIALDDFGAGASDVRRVWRLKPDIVKLDRSLIVAAARDDHALRVLKNIVNMMHDCGARVVLEGVEDRLEAEAAVESSADFLQGYYFGRPGTERLPDSSAQAMLQELLPRGQVVSLADAAAPVTDLAAWHDHAEALTAAVMAIETGAAFSAATDLLHSLPGTVRCCLLARDGRILSASADHRRHDSPTSPAPCAAVYRVGWRVKSLARQAAADPGVVKLTMPYVSSLASATSRYGVTLCYAFNHHDEVVALCVDVVY